MCDNGRKITSEALSAVMQCSGEKQACLDSSYLKTAFNDLNVERIKVDNH